LNASFLPSGIAAGTWTKLVGNNADQNGAHAALVPENAVPTSTPLSVTVNEAPTKDDVVQYAKEQVDLDVLASKVINVGVYDATFNSATWSSGTIADGLRGTADPNAAMKQYNWRPGTGITQYAKFHGLPALSLGNADAVTTEPPAALFDTTALTTDGLAFFSSPARMTFEGTNPVKPLTATQQDTTVQNDKTYGSYTLAPGQSSGLYFNPERQKVAILIQKALTRNITVS
jgi:hypothetical protein